MKKTMALLLALVMLFALAVPAMAATTTTGTITINKAAEGETYNAYLIFDLESYDETKNAYSYKVHNGWNDFVTTGAGKDYVTVSNGYVTWNPAKTTGTENQAFAEAAIAYAKASSITATATAICAEDENSVTMSSLALGYYVIETERSGANTLCILTTTDPTVNVDAKPEIPTPDKEVQEDSNETWGKTNDADIGQTVDFTSTINVKEGYTAYVMHDKMSDGLTFGAIESVYYKHGETTTKLGSSYYTVKTTDLADTDCTFEIEFTNAFYEDKTNYPLKSGDEIIVYYTAVLNEDAIIGDKGNPNDSWITYYHNGNEYESVKSETITKTWELKVFKYTETTIDNETKQTPLSGARFELRREAGKADTAIEFEDITSTEKDATPTYRVAKDGETSITTDAGGEFILQGLDSDTYYLVETQAPAGYNKLEDPIMVNIDKDGKVYLVKEKDASGGIQVEYEYTYLADKTVGVVNNTGSKLPETGGIGTTVFYVLGAALVVGALVVLVTRKRMNNNG